MRELNKSELNEVSGAGVVTDAGTALGMGIGAILSASGVKGGQEAAIAMGNGIGAIAEIGFNSLTSFFRALFNRR